MTKVTWDFIERLGVPSTAVRGIFLQLAEIIGAEGSGEVGLAAAAYRALIVEFEEMYTPKSPLQQQRDYLRNHKELEALLGTELPTIPGEAFQLEPVPETPAQLAESLGRHDGGRSVRRVLRDRFQHRPGKRWAPLSTEQINYVRAHLAKLI